MPTNNFLRSKLKSEQNKVRNESRKTINNVDGFNKSDFLNDLEKTRLNFSTELPGSKKKKKFEISPKKFSELKLNLFQNNGDL